MCAATRCFAERGFGATRVRHVAEAAGVSEGALYRHFASMDELARESYSQGLSLFASELAVAEGAGVPLGQLERMARRVLTGYREMPDAFVFVLLRTPPAAAAGLPAGCDFPVDVVSRVIVRGQADGSVRAGDPRLLASAFLGTVLQPIAMAHATPECVPDLLADASHDDTLVAAAIGSVAAR